MNSKPMLFECLGCGETYLADNLCDGYNCLKSDGMVAGLGYVKEIEERLKEGLKKIDKAKENGLIRKYNLPSPNNYIGGVDLGSGKDYTTHTININFNPENADIDKIRETIIESISNSINPRNPKRSGAIE